MSDHTVSHSQIVDAIQPGASLTSSKENTTPSSGLEGLIGFDFPSAELDPLDTMFDVPADFDWVSCHVAFQRLIQVLYLLEKKNRTYT